MADCDCEYVEVYRAGRITPARRVLAAPCQSHAEKTERHRLWLNPEVRYDGDGVAYVCEGSKPPC